MACLQTSKISSEANNLDHVAKLVGVCGTGVDRARSFAQESAYGVELRRHVGEPQEQLPVLDQRAATLDIALHVVRGPFERSHTDAQVLRALDDLARAEIDPRLARAIAFDQADGLWERAVLEHNFTVVHEAPAHRLVATTDNETRAYRAAQESSKCLAVMPTPGLVVGVDGIEASRHSRC